MIKKIVAFVLTIAMVMGCIIVVYADNNITTTLENGVLTITGIGKITGSWLKNTEITKVVIGEGITEIPEKAFEQCTNLVEVELPSTMETINNWAFYMCGNLETINLVDNISYIGQSCFATDSKLVDVHIPNNLTVIEDSVFLGTGITEITLTTSISAIQNSAFRMTKLTSIEIPSTVKSIGVGTFCACDQLKTVILNEGLETIGKMAFMSTDINEITLPSTITNIGACFPNIAISYNGTISQFNEVNINGNNLTNITPLLVDNDNIVKEWNCTSSITCALDKDGTLTFTGNGRMEDYTFTELAEYMEYAKDIKAIVVENGITYISDYAFYGLDNLETITLPNNDIEIGNYSFYECVKLAEINTDKITNIGNYTFYGCELLYDIDIASYGANALNFNGDNDYAYDMSLARYNAIIDYLNEVYTVNNELAFDIDYVVDKDIEELTNLADYITADCDTEYERAYAIWNWVDWHISYGVKGFSPIDVLRNRNGLCSGQANLLATLLRLNGIRATVVRGYKENTTTLTLKGSYLNSSYNAHEWVMAYVNGEWYHLDTVYNMYGMTSDITVMATNYFPVNIDGIAIYTPYGFDDTKCDSLICHTYYISGQYIGMIYGQITNYGLANLQVGGCLAYTKQYNNGYAITNSWYGKYYYKSNGIAKQGGRIGNTVVCDSGIVNAYDFILVNGFSNNTLNAYIGQTFDFEDYNDLRSTNTDVAIVNGTVVEVVGKGTTTIYNGYNELIPITCYGNVIDSFELFQELCSHEEVHEVEEHIYCNYCGLEIEEETVEEVEEVITTSSAITMTSSAITEEDISINETVNEVVELKEELTTSSAITTSSATTTTNSAITEEEVIEVVEEETVVEEVIETVKHIISIIFHKEEVVELIHEEVIEEELPVNETIIEEVIEPITVEEEVIEDIIETAYEPIITALVNETVKNEEVIDTTVKPISKPIVEPLMTIEEVKEEVVEEETITETTINEVEVIQQQTLEENLSLSNQTFSLLTKLQTLFKSIVNFLKGLFN